MLLEEHEPGSRVPPAERRRLKLLAEKPQPTGGREIHLDSTPTPLAPNVGTNFNGLGQNGWIPYDAALAPGPTQIVVMTNAQWIVYDRAGAVVRAVTSFGTWWGTPAGVPFDPKCFYDAVADRFVMLAISETSTGGNKAFYHLSISQTGDATGPWYNYQFDATKDGTTSTSNWADFPGLGYDDNAVYITSNQFQFTGLQLFQYAKIRVLSKAQLYAGNAATFTDFVGAVLRNSDSSQAFTVQPARTLSSTGSEYFLNTNSNSNNTVTLWRMDGAPASPALVRQATYSVGAFTFPPDAPQKNTTTKIATNDDRMYDFVWRSGIIHASFGEGFNGLAAIRYLRLDTTNNTLIKDVTYTQTGVNYYFPAVTDDSAGNLYMIFSRSSSTEFASVYHTGMQPADSAIQPSALVKAGVATNTSGRWGDYSAIANDPADSLAVVSYAGWANSSNRWATWITGATFGSGAPTPTLVSVIPSSGTQGASVNVTLTGQNTNWVQGTSAINISGTGVTASNVNVASATSMTATFDIGASAATGTRNVTVTTGAEVTTSAPFTVNGLLPTLTSINPTTGNQGTVTPVTLTGTNFVAPATINIGGTNVTASNVVVQNATTITADFTIGATATTGDRLVSVTTPGGTSGTVKFRVLGIPVISSISPNNGNPGTTVAVTILGSQFNSGNLNISPSTGISITGFKILNNATKITANFVIAANAPAGARNVTVSNAAGTSNAVVFTVNGTTSTPTLSSISPNSGTQGTNVGVTLTGTNFIAGASINFSGTGITANNIVVSNSTTIAATFVIAANAPLGAQNVSVTTSNGTSNTQSFTVNAPSSTPTLSGISPNSGTQGTNVGVTLTGSNFISGASINFSGTGVTASNVVISNSTTITATFSIAANAPLGAQNVSVTTSNGTSNTRSFTINAPAPTLTAINPTSGNQGTVTPVTLTGTNFMAPATISIGGTSVTASNIVVQNSTTITADFTIGATATTGDRLVSVTTPGGTTGTVKFRVLGVPIISSISPTSGARGTTVAVTILGSQFNSGEVAITPSADLSINTFRILNNATKITFNLVIGAAAATGPRSVTVYNAAGTSNAVTFTIN